MEATMLLHNMPEPLNSQARRIRDKVQGLLHVVAAQQVESSASRQRGAATEKCVEPAQNEREVSVHQEPPPQLSKVLAEASTLPRQARTQEGPKRG